MKEAEEFFESRNGGKPPEDSDFITGIFAVQLMKSYAKEIAVEFAVEVMTPYTTDNPPIIKDNMVQWYDEFINNA